VRVRADVEPAWAGKALALAGPTMSIQHEDGAVAAPVAAVGTALAANLTHLQRLEAESIHIMREVVAECERPVMLYSIGKDSSVMLHLAMKAFYPAVPPFPFLHVDTTWKFREMIAFRDETARRLGLDLRVYINEDGVRMGIDPFRPRLGAAHRHHEDAGAQTGARPLRLRRRLRRRQARRGEVARQGARLLRPLARSTAGIRSSSGPSSGASTTRARSKGESVRVFPLSNWTELDVWQYIYLENIPIVPLYFARPRPVVERDGTLIMVDDDRMPLDPGETFPKCGWCGSARSAATR
jgi:sulfate adenylyltransferase subunit 2